MSIDDEQYVLIIDKDDAEKLDYEQLSKFKKVFLEFNIDSDVYDIASQTFSDKCLKFEGIQSFNFLIEGSKKISLKSYQNIANILKQANKCSSLTLEIQFDNKFDNSAAAVLALPLDSFTSLNELNLIIRAENHLSAQGINDLVKSIEKLKQLTKFHFVLEDGNSFGYEGSKYLGQCIQTLENLQYLDLEIGDEIIIEEEGSQLLCQSIQKLKQLLSLRFAIGYGNDFGNLGIQNLSQSLAQLANIQKLIIKIGRKNKITQEGFKYFGEGMKNLSKLTEFILQIDEWNELGVIGGEQLALGVQQCKALKKLYLIIGHFNKLTTEGGQKLSKIVSQLTNLAELKLFIGAENNFGDNSLICLSENLCQLQNLQILHLQFESINQIGDKGIIGFSKNLTQLKQLKELKIKIDELNEATIESTCQAMDNLSKIQQLEKLQLKCSKIMKLEYIQQKKSLSLEINQKVSDEQIKNFFNGLSRYQQLSTIKINLVDLFELSESFINPCIMFLKEQQSIVNFKLISQNQGDYQACSILKLFAETLKSEKIEKSVISINDLIKCGLELYQTKAAQYKIQFFILAYVGAKIESCKEIASIINSKQLKLRSISIQIQQENQLTKECGQLLCESIIKCPCATEIQLELNDSAPVISQSLKQMSVLLQKIVSDRSRNLKTYYRIFAKVMTRYKNKIDYNIITNVGQYLPLMKEFHVQQPNQNQAGLFGQGNQFPVFNNQIMFQDEVETEEFNSDSDY